MLFKEKSTKLFISFILVFNIIDILVSTRYIRYGHLSEENPLMRVLLSMNSLMPFIVLKSFLVCGGLYILYQKRRTVLSQIGLYFCFCFYWGLVIHFYYFLIK